MTFGINFGTYISIYTEILGIFFFYKTCGDSSRNYIKAIDQCWGSNPEYARVYARQTLSYTPSLSLLFWINKTFDSFLLFLEIEVKN